MSEKPDYAAMTVNERLFTASLLEAFDRAARSRNRARMTEILAKVEIRNAAATVGAILVNPEKYGY